MEYTTIHPRVWEGLLYSNTYLTDPILATMYSLLMNLAALPGRIQYERMVIVNKIDYTKCILRVYPYPYGTLQNSCRVIPYCTRHTVASGEPSAN